MKKIQAATCSDNYDIVFTDNGMVSVENETSGSLVNMLKLDFNSNDDWELDEELGLHWLSDNNDGYLQLKKGENSIVVAIQRKLAKMEGVSAIKEMTISRSIQNRIMGIECVVLSEDGETINIGKEVASDR